MNAPAPEDKDALIAWQQGQIEYYKERARVLEAKVDYLIRQIYGSKSEKLDPGQLELLLNGEEAKKPEAAESPGSAAEEGASRPRTPVRREQRMRRSMEHLEREEQILLPEEVSDSQEDYTMIGQEVTERLEVDPARYWVRRIVRPVFVPKAGGENAKPLCAPLPPTLLEGSVLSASLAADILEKKYCQHLPFYRQEQQMRTAHGLEVDRTMLCHWHGVAADWLEPLYNLLVEELRGSGYVQADETPVGYLAPGTGRTATGYFWVYRSPENGVVVYDWHTGRSNQCLERVLAGFEGTLQSDGFAAYETWRRLGTGKIKMVSCLAHIRRKFEAALDQHPKAAGWFIKQIGHLYALEREMRQARAGPAYRLVQRQARAGPVMRRIREAMIRMRAKSSVLPSSALGKALDYALAEWDGLMPCLEDGRIELDNNGVENAIRPLKLGAKNWLFIGGGDLGQRAAIVLTLVENVRRLGLSPRDYLQWVFERLPAMTNQDDLQQVLPAAWAAQLARANRSAA